MTRFLICLLFLLTCSVNAQLRFEKTVESIAALRLLDTRDIHKAVYVRGFNTPGDGGQGVFVADQISVVPHFPGMVETNIGPGRFLRHYDRPEFPATWFGTPVTNSVIKAGIKWASTNGFGYVIMPVAETPIDPVDDPIELKHNVSLVWPPGSSWVIDHIPSTNWTMLSIVGVTNFGIYAPSITGVTNIPGDIANFGRLITVLGSTNGVIDDPKLEAEYSDKIYWGDDVTTNGNRNVTITGVPQYVFNANVGTRLSSLIAPRRASNLVELSEMDVSKDNMVAQVFNQADPSQNGLWQYDPDSAAATNIADTVALVNFGGRFLRQTPYIAGFGGGTSGVIGSGTPPHLAYWFGPTNLADSSLIQVDQTNVLSLGNFAVTNGQFGAWNDGSALFPAYSLNGLGSGFGFFRDANGDPSIAEGGVSVARFSSTSLRIPGGQAFAWTVGNPETTVIRQGLYQGTGSPEGVVTANIGSAYWDYATGDQYNKKADNGANTGWVLVASGGGGTTINPTDGFLPVRSNATTFGDSSLFQVTPTTLAHMNSGIPQFIIDPSGGITSGPNTSNFFGGLAVTGELLNFNDTTSGDPNGYSITFGAGDPAFGNLKSLFIAEGADYYSGITASHTSAAGLSSFVTLLSQDSLAQIESEVDGVSRMLLAPGSDESGPAYIFDTATYRTNSAMPQIDIRNLGTNIFSIYPGGPIKLNGLTKAQKTALTPANGTLLYQTDNTPGFRAYVNGAWFLLSTAADP